MYKVGYKGYYQLAVAEHGGIAARGKYVWAPHIGVVEIHLRAKVCWCFVRHY